MTNILKHAKQELALLGYAPVEQGDENDMNTLIQKHILDLLELFASQGHSGMSASYVLGVFFKLAQFEPLKPLTGEDSEWEKVDFQTWQNIRCSRVFKLLDGSCFDVAGKVFEEPDGARYTSKESRIDITFPYMPHTEVIKVSGEREFENVSTDTDNLR